MRPLTKAILISPLAAIPASALSFAVLPNSYYGLTESRTVLEYCIQTATVSAFTVPISFVAIILFGVPLHFLMKRATFPTTPWYLGIAGAVAATLAWQLSGSFALFWQLLSISSAIAVSWVFSYLLREPEQRSSHSIGMRFVRKLNRVKWIRSFSGDVNL